MPNRKQLRLPEMQLQKYNILNLYPPCFTSSARRGVRIECNIQGITDFAEERTPI